jgi:hypothetical protein
MSKFARKTTITILNNEYEIEYPNTGQQINIELLKAQIADGNYEAMRFSTNPLFQEQANKIDMIATFNTLIPKLKQDLSVKSIFDLSEEQGDVLLTAYLDQFMAWYLPIKEAVKNPKQALEDVKDEK